MFSCLTGEPRIPVTWSISPSDIKSVLAYNGPTTLSIIKFSITTLGIMSFSIMTLSTMTLSIAITQT